MSAFPLGIRHIVGGCTFHISTTALAVITKKNCINLLCLTMEPLCYFEVIGATAPFIVKLFKMESCER